MFLGVPLGFPSGMETGLGFGSASRACDFSFLLLSCHDGKGNPLCLWSCDLTSCQGNKSKTVGTVEQTTPVDHWWKEHGSLSPLGAQFRHRQLGLGQAEKSPL